jgi:hypothetical protein
VEGVAAYVASSSGTANNFSTSLYFVPWQGKVYGFRSTYMKILGAIFMFDFELYWI